MTASIRNDGMLDSIQMAASDMPRATPLDDEPQTLEKIYSTDGLAAVIVDRMAEDALSRGFVVEGDEDETVLNEIDRLDAIQHLTDALRWARLHGAGAILMLVDDSSTLQDELNLPRLRRIHDLITYPVSAISAGAERYDDPSKANYGEPIYYQLTPRQGASFSVHESRLLRVPGDPISYSHGANLAIPWIGRPALDGCMGDLQRYRKALQLTRAILERKQQPIYQMEGLSELLALPGGEGMRMVRDQLHLVDLMRGIFTTVTVDAKDKFSVLDASVGGIDALLNAFRIALAASSFYPVPILFGEGLSGLGNSGSGEQGIYHGKVRTTQERSLRPAVERLVSLIWAQSEVRKREPEKWRVTFNPLWSPSEAELAKTALDKANARKAEIEALDALGALGVTQEEIVNYVAEAMPEYGFSKVASGTEILPDDDEPPEAPAEAAEVPASGRE